MRVGVVAEIKPGERRVALTPAGAHELCLDGHEVLVQAGAGVGAGFEDPGYVEAGASIIASATEVWDSAELLLKVKEPIASEYEHLRDDQMLFTYLHLAAEPELTEALLSAGTTAIAYETVEDAHGGLPLLAPMSEIAGRLAALVGAFYLQAPLQGSGILIGGAPGVAPARVLVVGGGEVGTNAARVAIGMGAEVTLLERSIPRIHQLEQYFAGRARVLMSDTLTLKQELTIADVVIGAVLLHGARAPRLVRREDLATIKRGSVIVDVAIDQGGSVETARPTTHADPTYVIDGVVHYCVANMPGAVPVTSTRALTNATLPYARRLAAGAREALAADPGLAAGLNVDVGEILHRAVARAREARSEHRGNGVAQR